MNVMVTGDRGYIGSVLTDMLLGEGYNVIGLDCGYFTSNLLRETTASYQMLTKDIRDVCVEDLVGLDAIIHLAGLSNDPLGEINPKHTMQINAEAAVRLAEVAKKAGVGRFVFASSQSIYGVSDVTEEIKEDSAEINPITAYAKAKWEAEKRLLSIVDDSFTCVFFRPSTVFGVSARLRCDIVFNNMLACAYTTGQIEILSDGSPWRPIIHVRDVSAAFICGLKAPAKIINGRAYNVGLKGGNYKVKEIAEAAQRAVPGSKLIFTGHHGHDARTYKVNFDRISTELRDYFKPQWSLKDGGQELVKFFDDIDFNETQFRGRTTIRLKQLQHLTETHQIDNTLRFN